MQVQVPEIEKLTGIDIYTTTTEGIGGILKQEVDDFIVTEITNREEGKEMTKYGALLAVLSNLENEDYVKTVLGVVDDFVRELQNVTDEELQEARQLIRKFPQLPLVKSDVRRPEILRDFVALVEDEFEEVADADIGMWLSNFIDTDARLTPYNCSFRWMI